MLSDSREAGVWQRQSSGRGGDDFIDGWLARKWGGDGARQVSRSAGRQADRHGGPDHADPFGRIRPGRFLVLAREIIVTGLRSIASSEGLSSTPATWANTRPSIRCRYSGVAPALRLLLVFGSFGTPACHMHNFACFLRYRPGSDPLVRLRLPLQVLQVFAR